jgi:hypothetical protein
MKQSGCWRGDDSVKSGGFEMDNVKGATAFVQWAVSYELLNKVSLGNSTAETATVSGKFLPKTSIIVSGSLGSPKSFYYSGGAKGVPFTANIMVK